VKRSLEAALFYFCTPTSCILNFYIQTHDQVLKIVILSGAGAYATA
jgi:hypothetical protein